MDPNDFRRSEFLARPVCIATDSVFDHDTSGSWLSVTLANDLHDPYDLHSTSSNTSRLNVPQGGIWMLMGNVIFPANSTGKRGVRFRRDGSVVITEVLVPSTATGTCGVSAMALARVGQGNSYIEMQAFQDSGGTLSNLSSQFSVSLVALRA